MFINQILTKLKSLVYSKSETDSLLNGKASSSHTHTKSQITDFPSLATVATSGSYNDLSNKPSIPSNTNQLTNGAGYITSSGSCNYATTAGAVSTSVAEGSTKDLIVADMTGWDSCWIRFGGASDAGYLEIATGDNANEPIYVRQYYLEGGNARTLTLLDGSGNTQFPGTVTAPTFTGNVTGNCSGTAGGVAWTNVSGKPSTFTPSSHTHTKSQITDFPTIPSKVSELTNDSGFITSSGSCSYANSAGSADVVNTVVADGSSKVLVYADMNSDSCHISCGVSDNDSWMEIATADDKDEPIYVKQYYWNGDPRILTLLDGNGNTTFPGTVYVPTSIVNSSDSRLKNSVTNIDDALLDAWENIEPKQYKFNDATEEKGDKARYHTGYLAQDIQTECEKQGVNASDYGLFCYDEWDEQEEISEEIEKEKDGKIVKEKRIIRPKREKGDRYSLRYAEALVVECKYLRRENSRLKENLASIEERLEKLEKAENS